MSRSRIGGALAVVAMTVASLTAATPPSASDAASAAREYRASLGNVLPFQEQEYCRTVTFPIGTRIFELSSHTHQRGRLFRVWGPGIASSCNSRSTRFARVHSNARSTT